MKQYEQVKDLFFKEMFDKSFGIYLKEGLLHSISVSRFAILIAKKRGLNEELMAIAGLLHDIHTYTTMNSFRHAYYSSIKAQELLKKTDLMEEELNTITLAIHNHSYKESVQDVYSECLKDADVLDHYLQNTVKDVELPRVNTLRVEKFI